MENITNGVLSSPINKVDIENMRYTLLIKYVFEDDVEETWRNRSWEIFDTRTDAYNFIKENLFGDDEDNKLIDITDSFVLPEFATINDATPLRSFFEACASVFGEDLDLTPFIIEK